jgi:hypothetical protein
VGGIAAGTVYQLVQFAYIKFQIGVDNAIKANFLDVIGRYYLGFDGIIPSFCLPESKRNEYAIDAV